MIIKHYEHSMENHRCKYIVSCDGLTKGRVKSITTAECIKVLPLLALRQVVENESASSIQYNDPIRSPLWSEHLTQRSRSHYETFQLETLQDWTIQLWVPETDAVGALLTSGWHSLFLHTPRTPAAGTPESFPRSFSWQVCAWGRPDVLGN